MISLSMNGSLSSAAPLLPPPPIVSSTTHQLGNGSSATTTIRPYVPTNCLMQKVSRVWHFIQSTLQRLYSFFIPQKKRDQLQVASRLEAIQQKFSFDGLDGHVRMNIISRLGPKETLQVARTDKSNRMVALKQYLENNDRAVAKIIRKSGGDISRIPLNIQRALRQVGPSIRSLDLLNISVTAQQFEAIISLLPHIHHLTIGSTSVRSKEVQRLQDSLPFDILKNLKKLTVHEMGPSATFRPDNTLWRHTVSADIDPNSQSRYRVVDVYKRMSCDARSGNAVNCSIYTVQSELIIIDPALLLW